MSDIFDTLLDGDEFNVDNFDGLLHSYLDYLEGDSITNPNIRWKVDSGDDVIRGCFYQQFSNWVNREVDDRWFDIVDDDGHDIMKEYILSKYKEDDDFRSRVNDNIMVINERNAKEGIYSEVMEKYDNNNEDDDEMKRYGELHEIGIVDEDMEVDEAKLRGAALSFVKDVDEILGTEDELNRDDLRTSFNRWMLDKFGSDWTKFISEKLEPGDLMDVVLFMYKKNEDFRRLSNEKYEYDPEQLEGNSRMKERRLMKKKQNIVKYNDEEINPSENGQSEDEEDNKERDSDRDEIRDDINITGADVIHGDCTDVVERMDGKIDAVITDPPYGMDYDSRGDEHDVIIGDDDLGHALKITEDVLKKSRMYLTDGSPVVVFASKENLCGVMNMLDKWYDFKDINIWSKDWVGTSQIGGNPVRWRPNHEYVCLAMYGEPKSENEKRHDGNVWEFRRLDSDSMPHPTAKPVELMKYIIEALTEEGDVVFDPFCGGGSTVVAAKQSGRGYLGVELDEEYYNKTRERLKQGTISEW